MSYDYQIWEKSFWFWENWEILLLYLTSKSRETLLCYGTKIITIVICGLKGVFFNDEISAAC